MSNNWKTIWEKRTIADSIFNSKDNEQIFLELKRANGFDIIKDKVNYNCWFEQYEEIKNKLMFKKDKTELKSIFEVGCGSGANLFLFKKDGYEIGGIDYSNNLIEIAKKILKENTITCNEAIDLSTEKKYDSILSNSVFSYFNDYDYAKNVLEKMFQKANYNIGLIDIHDVAKKDDFLSYRKKTIINYHERYKNLSKLFYPKSFFAEFANSHNLEIEFVDSNVEGYWNNEFVYGCYMYKR